MARPRRKLPVEMCDDWPEGACDDPVGEAARVLAGNLREALDGRSLRTAKAVTGVDHTTIAAILNGRTWPDIHTLARLEHGLEADLWPGRGGADRAAQESAI